MKKVLGVLGIAGFVSASAVSAAPEFGAQLEVGMKGSTGGAFSPTSDDNRNSGAIGPYVHPMINFNYSGEGYSTYAAYELYLETGAKYGPNQAADFNRNISFMHYPYAGVAIDMPNQFKGKIDAEATYTTYSGDQEQSDNALFFAALPAIERKLNDRFTVGVAYVFMREQGLDPVTPTRENAIANINKQLAKENNGNDNQNLFNNLPAEEQQERLFNQIALDGQTAVSTHQLGRAYVNTKLSDSLSLSTYVQGGRKLNNKERADTTEARLHNELKATITSDLSARLRHRVNARQENADNWSLTNQVRLIGEYQMASNWGVYLESTLGVTNSQAAGNSKPVTYSNETYLGLVYGF